MPKMQDLLELQWSSSLSEYVTALAWSNQGQTLAASTASGEIVIYHGDSGEGIQLQTGCGQSIDCLSFSADGQFLATAGQEGIVRIWQMDTNPPQLWSELEYQRVWIDRLQWHPQHPELAFSLGRYAQVWNVQTKEILTTLNFELSSVLDLTWHPEGEDLALSGNQGIKIWKREDWDDDPQVWHTGTVNQAIAWSSDGDYLASGNRDRTLLVWQWGNPYPWQMQGFPGKVGQLAWSKPTDQLKTPLLATMSSTAVVVWQKSVDEAVGWEATVLDWHTQKVNAIAFKPGSLLLTSASEDGRVYLSQNASRVGQMLKGAPQGFSCLNWHPQGRYLAAGGQHGEVLVWTTSRRGQGFG
jgi:WD40 repeat protein